MTKNKPFAVFDIDGTLIRWQLYHSVLDKLAAGKIISPRDYQEVLAKRVSWKERHPDTSFADYQQTVADVFENYLSQIDYSIFLEIIDAVFDEQKDQVYIFTREMLKKLKSKGYKLIAISGSHQEIVEKIAKYYGFDFWAGTIYARTAKGFSGKVVEYQYRKKDKTLRKFIDENSLSKTDSIGVGDTESDISMLAMVENPIAFNPTKGLLKHAVENKWKVVVERKNVVYELDSKDGKYHLSF